MPRVETLFAGASEFGDAAQRERWLREQCGDDPDLIGQVMELLRCADEESAAQQAALLRIQEQGVTVPGVPEAEAGGPAVNRMIGAYRADRVLGSGGMGTVYLAHRESGDVDQTVAIKVLSEDAASETFLRYFREERQILAKLVHPNVTRFLDSGTMPGGAPYLVMEYVDGEHLHRWQDSRTLDIAARLALFRKICAAVSFLHQNLILHRDLKPSNILVTAEGEPKLLDFGAAKALAQSDKTMTMAPLTPRYASPEQVLGKLVTTQSDVYALGVILYESLTGAWPFGDPESTGNSMGRFFGSAPARTPAGTVTEEAAKTRVTSAASLKAALSGDLGRIAMKALEYEPGERYESVAAFSEDIRRYLAEEPVLAQSQTVGYRVGKFIRRHRAAVAAGVLFVLGISAAAGVAIWQARAARVATIRAEQRFQDVRKLTRLVMFRFFDEVAKLPGGMEVQQTLLQQTLEQFDALVKESNRDPEILAEAGEGYSRIAALQGNQYANNKGDVAGSIETYRKGIALLQGGGSPSVDLTLGKLYRGLGRTLWSGGDAQAAVKELERSEARFEAALRGAPSIDIELELMQTRNTIGDILLDSDPKRALVLYDAAVPVIEKARRAGRSQSSSNGVLSYKRGACKELLGDMEGAVELYRQGLAENDRLPASDRAATANRRARGSLLSVLGSGLAALGRGAEAIPYLDESAQISRAIAEADPGSARAHYSLAVNLNNRSAAYRLMGSGDRLHRALLEEETAWNAVLAKSQIPLYLSGAASNLDALSRTFAGRGDANLARQYSVRALDMLRKVAAGKPNPEDRRRLAAVLLESPAANLRDPKLALAQLEQAMRESPNPPAGILRAWGLALLRSGRPKEAIAPLEKAIAMLTPKGGAATPDVAETREWLREATAAGPW